MQSKTHTNFTDLKRHDPDKVFDVHPNMQPAQVDLGPLAKARVARGRSIHIPNGALRVVGTRAFEVNGTVVYKDVTAADYHSAQPGEVVELPETEIARLTSLGFLVALDDKAARKGNGKAPVNPDTGVANDTRLPVSTRSGRGL